MMSLSNTIKGWKFRFPDYASIQVSSLLTRKYVPVCAVHRINDLTCNNLLDNFSVNFKFMIK